MRCSPEVAEVLPILYLRGLSTGDFEEALGALVGYDASGLSPTAITRKAAQEVIRRFEGDCRDKYPKAVASLRKDEAELPGGSEYRERPPGRRI
jgi:hypothetical protein